MLIHINETCLWYIGWNANGTVTISSVLLLLYPISAVSKRWQTQQSAGGLTPDSSVSVSDSLSLCDSISGMLFRIGSL